ncbi:protein krueppel-like isoform X2 [Agrilus planipennis]|uniref:Protein krueppel-like isoform X2 n=1 Tax=Agrilus planipennis TaxID=224129 RepID=A0A7F5RJJ4_AGRPL|nr:protein krueppel-like isoform X2 [Agrilus planipennis]
MCYYFTYTIFRGTLRRHEWLHTGVRPFECSTCSKRFAIKWQLTSHLRVHTGEKPYECLVCQKRFPEKYRLDLHMRVHAEEKQFKCETCGQGFTQENITQTLGIFYSWSVIVAVCISSKYGAAASYSLEAETKRIG